MDDRRKSHFYTSSDLVRCTLLHHHSLSTRLIFILLRYTHSDDGGPILSDLATEYVSCKLSEGFSAFPNWE